MPSRPVKRAFAFAASFSGQVVVGFPAVGGLHKLDGVVCGGPLVALSRQFHQRSGLLKID